MFSERDFSRTKCEDYDQLDLFVRHARLSQISQQFIRRLTLSLVTFNIVFKITVVKRDHVLAVTSCFKGVSLTPWHGLVT